jgi:NitT/TauT family transport system substrate-binding protein
VAVAESVRFHADWFPGAPYAGLYVAMDKGLFAAAGLEVTLVPFAFGQDAPAAIDADPEVAAVGFAEGYIFLQHHARRVEVCAFTAVLCESPAGLISLAGRPISSARDFSGRTLGVHRFAEEMFQWFAEQAGLGTGDYTLRVVGNELDLLANGEIDGLQGYAIEELVQAQRRFGEDRVRFLPFRDLGYSSYAQVIYSSRAKAIRHASTLAAFVSALREGWVHALANPDAALAAVLPRLDGAADPVEQRAMLHALADYVSPGGKMPLGSFDPEKWRKAGEVARAMGLIPRVEEPTAFCFELPRTPSR